MAAVPDPRRGPIADPGGADAWDAYLRTPGPDASQRAAGWFHRRLRLGKPIDAVTLRRALLSAETLDRASLLAIDGPLRDDTTAGIVGAVIHLAEARGAETGARRYDNAAPWPQRLRAAAAIDPAVSVLSEAAQVLQIRTHVMGALHRAGLIEQTRDFAVKTASFRIRVRRRVYGGRRPLTGSWTAHIGHLAMLAHLAHGARAGLFDGAPLQVWTERIANRPLLERIAAQIGGIEMVAPGLALAENHLSLIPELVGGRFRNHFDAYDHVLRQAPPERGALLRPLAGDAEAVGALLRDAGLPSESRVVTVHVRATSTDVSPAGAIRNADIRRLTPALRELAAAGYAVVRMGNPSMPRVPELPGVFDYAHSTLKSPAMDVALAAISHLHIGGSSGLSLVPMLFGVPTLFADWYPVHLIPHGASHRVVLKGLVDRATGRLLDTEADHRRFGALIDPGVLADAGVRLTDLTEDHLGAAVRDFVLSADATRGSPTGDPGVFIPTETGLRPVARDALRVL